MSKNYLAHFILQKMAEESTANGLIAYVYNEYGVKVVHPTDDCDRVFVGLLSSARPTLHIIDRADADRITTVDITRGVAEEKMITETTGNAVNLLRVTFQLIDVCRTANLESTRAIDITEFRARY